MDRQQLLETTVESAGDTEALHGDEGTSGTKEQSECHIEFPGEGGRANIGHSSATYQSLDYDTCINSVLLDEERTKGYSFVVKKAFSRWVVIMMIGILTALVACAIDITVEGLTSFKYLWLQESFDKCVLNNCLLISYLIWVGLNAFPVFLAAVLGSCIEPVSAGSGIPQVKCYLNGVKVPRIVRIKTLICKVIGVTCSVLGGLAVGKEGPMVHSGAVIAAGVSQGKTTTFNKDFGLLRYFREDHEKRDFVSAGAAAGVAAAFGAPVGGVLFSLEEGASFWNQSLTWRVFFCAMVSCFTLNLVLSAYKGELGNLNNPGLLNFGEFQELHYEFYEFIPFLLMAVTGGLLGALFNFINCKLTIFRMKYIHQSWRKVLEALIVAIVTASAGFVMIYTVSDCRDIKDSSGGFPIKMYCEDGEQNVAAILWFQTPEENVRSLFHDDKGAYGWATLSVYTVLYYFLACWTYGLGIPSGLFIPTLLTGAAWGRITGMLLNALFPDNEWVDEGKYALVGAGAMLGGVVRMTISLTVILMECIGSIKFGLPLMIILILSKWVGDFFNEGIYDIHIHLTGVPIIPWNPPPLANSTYASEVMNCPVIALKPVEKVKNIVDVLKSCSHSGFPVIDSVPEHAFTSSLFQPSGALRGLILRSQLTVLLKHKIFNEREDAWQSDQGTIEIFRSAYPRFYDLDAVDLQETDMECSVDLRPFMNPSPYVITSFMPLPRIFNLFRALGLRHLPVINDSYQVLGMVTRKDIVKYRIWKHRGQMSHDNISAYHRI